MNEEIYDPDCGACERAQQDYAELERVTDDLAALVRQLVRSLRKAAPDNELADKALDYLKRKGLQGSPLRHNIVDVPGYSAQLGDARATARKIEKAIRARGTA